MADELTVDVSLCDGTVVHLRPVVPGDKAALQDGMERLSPSSRYFRFFSPVQRLSDDQLRAFTELDYHDHFALAAMGDDPLHPGLGVARFIRMADRPEVAEFAVAVVDDWHRRGLGSLLLGALVLAAAANGVTTVEGEVLRHNRAMLGLAHRYGGRVEHADVGEVRVIFDVAALAADLVGPPWDEVRAVIERVAPPGDAGS